MIEGAYLRIRVARARSSSTAYERLVMRRWFHVFLVMCMRPINTSKKFKEMGLKIEIKTI